jgi:hypothetical protein
MLRRAIALSFAAALGAGAGLWPGSARAWDTGLILTSDYQSFGRVRSCQRHAPWAVSGDLEQVGTDPVARWHDGLVYVVNRAGDSNLQVLDPAVGYHTVKQFSLGAGRNPQDIAFGRDGTAWVSCYDQPVLLQVDVAAGAVAGTVSTAVFADADGLPETGWMQAVGDRLYVTCQRLDRNNYYAPTGPGLLAIFDMTARTWIDADPAHPGLDAIALVAADPSGQPELSADHTRLRLGCIGFYGLNDGGVEEVDLAGMRSLGFLISEGTLGGDLLDFVIVSPTRAYAIVSDASFHTSVRAWNPATGTVIGTVRASTDYAYVDLAWDGGSELYLADRTLGASGLRVFDAGSGVEQTGAAIATGLAPVSIVLPRDPQLVAIGPSGPPVPSRLTLEAFPNPANPGCTIQVRGSPAARVPLAVYDLRGRLLRLSTVMTGADGLATFRLDGRDGCGRPLPSGAYEIVAGAGADRASARLQIVR